MDTLLRNYDSGVRRSPRSAVRTYAVDLHNHMPLPGADYRGPCETTGAEVAAAAIGAGLDAIGVTDHFALGHYHEVADATRRMAGETEMGDGLLVIPGCEVRLSWRGDEAHLLALLPPKEADWRFDALMSVLGFDADRHSEEGHHRVVLEVEPVEAIHAIEALGGISIIAHADRTFGSYRLLGTPLLERILESAPVAAVELLDLANVRELGALAERVSFIRSSDSHHTDEIGRRSSCLQAEELSFEGIADALRARRVEDPAGR